MIHPIFPFYFHRVSESDTALPSPHHQYHQICPLGHVGGKRFAWKLYSRDVKKKEGTTSFLLGSTVTIDCLQSSTHPTVCFYIYGVVVVPLLPVDLYVCVYIDVKNRSLWSLIANMFNLICPIHSIHSLFFSVIPCSLISLVCPSTSLRTRLIVSLFQYSALTSRLAHKRNFVATFSDIFSISARNT